MFPAINELIAALMDLAPQSADVEEVRQTDSERAVIDAEGEEVSGES